MVPVNRVAASGLLEGSVVVSQSVSKPLGETNLLCVRICKKVAGFSEISVRFYSYYNSRCQWDM
jgi:hypothetical protein